VLLVISTVNFNWLTVVFHFVVDFYVPAVYALIEVSVLVSLHKCTAN